MGISIAVIDWEEEVFTYRGTINYGGLDKIVVLQRIEHYFKQKRGAHESPSLRLNIFIFLDIQKYKRKKLLQQIRGIFGRNFTVDAVVDVGAVLAQVQ